jgi:hypothetical protein
MQTRTILASIALACGFGCTTSHAVSPPELHADLPVPHVAAGIEGCFTGGGALVELGSVNNNDQHDHGALRTFGIAPNGLVAAAGSDGTLKFWTMSATLVGTADPSVLTYGPEIAAAPITDLAFSDTLAIAGDVRGLVEQLGPQGQRGALGGTTPGVPIIAVAFDRAARRLAHAEGPDPAGSAVTPLVVTALDGSMNAQITETLGVITDLAFAPDGTLVVVGSEGAFPAYEIRDAADPTRVLAHRTFGHVYDGAIEVAVAADGPEIVAVTNHGLYAITEAEARLLGSSDDVLASFESVDLTPNGEFAITVASGGVVTVWSTTSGEGVAHASVANAIGVRVDALGTRAVVGASDALLHVLSCR